MTEQQNNTQDVPDPKFELRQMVVAHVGSETAPSDHVGRVTQIRPVRVGTQISYEYVINDGVVSNLYPEDVLAVYVEPVPEVKAPDIPKVFTIVASSNDGGTISPSGSVSVQEADSPGFSISPSAGKRVADVIVDGASVGSTTTYSFTNVTSDHTIAVTFEDVPAPVATPEAAPADQTGGA